MATPTPKRPPGRMPTYTVHRMLTNPYYTGQVSFCKEATRLYAQGLSVRRSGSPCDQLRRSTRGHGQLRRWCSASRDASHDGGDNAKRKGHRDDLPDDPSSCNRAVSPR